MELKPLSCPSCGQTNSPLGVVNEAQQYRCAGCGMVYYGPAQCADEIEGSGASGSNEPELPDDRQIQSPSDSAE